MGKTCLGENTSEMLYANFGAKSDKALHGGKGSLDVEEEEGD